MNADRAYFLTVPQINTPLTEVFWEVGDCAAKTTNPPPNDRIVNVIDLTYVSFSVGLFLGDTDYDSAADFNENNFVGITDDVAEVAFHLLWRKEWP